MENNNYFKTKRLLLREITIADTDMIVDWRSPEEVYKYFTKPHKLSREEHINWYYNYYLTNENRIDFIAEGQDEPYIGVFSILRDTDDDSVEISYLVDKRFRGNGYASEAVNALMLEASKKWGITKMKAIVHRENIPSIHFVENLGFVKDTQYNNSPFNLYKRDI